MNASRLPLLLALLLTMTACQTSLIAQGQSPRSMAVLSTDEIVRALTKKICDKAWKGITYDSEHDTAETIDSARANNRARTVFCEDR